VRHLQLSRFGSRGFKGSRVQGFKLKTKRYSKKGTQILLAGDLGFIEEDKLGKIRTDIAENERMLKALTKSLKNKTLEPLNP